jgi:hypothetical protein
VPLHAALLPKLASDFKEVEIISRSTGNFEKKKRKIGIKFSDLVTYLQKILELANHTIIDPWYRTQK